MEEEKETNKQKNAVFLSLNFTHFGKLEPSISNAVSQASRLGKRRATNQISLYENTILLRLSELFGCLGITQSFHLFSLAHPFLSLSLSLFLSLSLSLSFSISLSFFLSLCLSLFLCPSVPLCLSVFLCLCVFLSLPHLSLSLSLSLACSLLLYLLCHLARRGSDRENAGEVMRFFCTGDLLGQTLHLMKEHFDDVKITFFFKVL